MNSVPEIEDALRQMPPEARWEVARWLLDDLQEQTVGQAGSKGSAADGQAAPPPPHFRKQGSAEHGSGRPLRRILVKTYADTSFLFSLSDTDANSIRA